MRISATQAENGKPAFQGCGQTQIPISFISPEISIVAKFENVSDTAYGNIM